ncbi:MAG: hypothetical protein M3R04_10330 [bacterium]|nr:hypothetical protein [bacterium]
MRIEAACVTCHKSSRPGLLWLGGGDWLECPDCTNGTVTFDESRFTPKERTVFIAGLKPHVEVAHHPSIARLT